MRPTRIESLADARRPRIKRRFRQLKTVPVLPSLVTLGNLYFGFLAMAKVADAGLLYGPPTGPIAPAALALFETAALLVFLAMVFDGLDGAVARLTNQTSAFGAQLDSLCDMVTFGVAPAFLTKLLIEYHAGVDRLLPAHPKLYYVAAAIYVLCAAMRLARFNVEVFSPAAEDHREFSGLPSPAAAAVVCSLIAFYATRNDADSLSSQLLPAAVWDWMMIAMPSALVILGLLMISRFPYPHMVATLVRGRHSFPFLATLVVLLFIAAIEWQLVVAAVTVLYVLSGVLLGLFRLLVRGRMHDGNDEDDGEPGGGQPMRVDLAPLN